MATVYHAYHPADGREVALKVLAIHLQDMPEVKTRFTREAQMLQQFDHPHILPVYDFGQDGERSYLAMRLLGGRSLAHVLSDGVPQPVEAVGRYTRQIASALDYAHARGIIHRDIKPANILLDGERVLLADFGVAQPTTADLRLTQARSFIGTAAYASPEQCRGDALDRRSDIYALAVLVFQMATGRLPFEAPSALGVIKLHLSERPPNPLAYNSALPIELYAVLERGLAKDPDDRYPSAMKFSDAVDEALGIHALPEADASEEWLVGDISPVTFDDAAPPESAPAPLASTAALPPPANTGATVPGTRAPAPSETPPQGRFEAPFEGLYADSAARPDDVTAMSMHFDESTNLDDEISFATAFGTGLERIRRPEAAARALAASPPHPAAIRPAAPSARQAGRDDCRI